MLRRLPVLLCLAASGAAGKACANDYEVGRTGWRLERLSDGLVLMRTDILKLNQDGPRGQGLLIAACEPKARRIRFQIGDSPKAPSTRSTAWGRAIVRGLFGRTSRSFVPFYPSVRLFEDGSFEFQEGASLGDGTMRAFTDVLTRLPEALEVILFKGPDIGAFSRGTALRFHLQGLDEGLATIYGFQGLCFRIS